MMSRESEGAESERPASESDHTNNIYVGFPASSKSREFLRLEVDRHSSDSKKLSGRGCTALLDLIERIRPLLVRPIHEIPLPTGSDHAVLLMRELLLRARGEWRPPYTEDEICHCRQIPTATVDEAIVRGARDVDVIRQTTGANTSCGACRYDIEKLIEYRHSGSSGEAE